MAGNEADGEPVKMQGAHRLVDILGDRASVTQPRLAPRWRITLGAIAVVLVILLGSAVAIWWQQSANRAAAAVADPGPSVAVPPTSTPGAAVSTGAAGNPSSATRDTARSGQGLVVVHVVGAVMKPGVFSLPAHSRVFQAIELAGGASPAALLSNINMAAEVVDGSQITVPTADDPQPMGPSPPAGSGGGVASGQGDPASPTTDSKVNINTASAEELATLPRVGPVLAQKIIDWRGQHGGFSNVNQLDAVDGIGPKLLATLEPLVTV